MNKLKSITWRVFQLLILPMAVYSGIYYNGLSFAEMHSGLTWNIMHYPSMLISDSILYPIASALAFIPTVLAYPLPSGFQANLYLFATISDQDLAYFIITLLFLTTKAPTFSWFKKKVSYATA